MKLKIAAAILIVLFSGASPVQQRLDKSAVSYIYSDDMDQDANGPEVFHELRNGSSGAYVEEVNFTVQSLRQEKACLFLKAEPAPDADWPEYAGTTEGIYERLFTVRNLVFSSEIELSKRQENMQELMQLYQETASPSQAAAYDNDYTRLLKKLSLVAAGDGGSEKVCPLQKNTALCYASGGQSISLKVTITVPEDLSEEERKLLQTIRWGLSAEEFNSSPELNAGLTLLSKPENGEYFIPGETVSVKVWYSNEGDIDLMHVIIRLLREGQNRERTELEHDVREMEGWNAAGIPSERVRNSFETQYRVSSADVKEGGVRLVIAADASCRSPEFPERMQVEKELWIPAGEKEETEARETDTLASENNDVESAEKAVQKTWILAAFLGISGVGILTFLIRRRKH